MAAMGRQKDAFTDLQAGSKPNALEIAQSADLSQMKEHGPHNDHIKMRLFQTRPMVLYSRGKMGKVQRDPGRE